MKGGAGMTRRWIGVTVVLGSIALAVTLHAPPGEGQPAAGPQGNNLDAEVTRVKKELRAIQDQPIPREAKVQQQRALIERESAGARARIRALQADLSKSTKESKESTEAQDSARDHKKAAQENLQKFLDILHSMNPQL
jgi:septal ring factor EnvC (AmiA/AmiB activator)